MNSIDTPSSKTDLELLMEVCADKRIRRSVESEGDTNTRLKR